LNSPPYIKVKALLLSTILHKISPKMANNDITLTEKLAVIPHLAIGLTNGFLRLASRPFTTSDGKPPTAYKDFVYAVLRHLLSNVNVKQEKWLSPPTETVYLNFARDKNFQPDTDVLPSGVKVHWIGNKSAEKVFLYFHGGGYVNAISPAHLEWLLELSTDLSKTKRVAVAVVGYTCSPEGQYPLQLQQGTESLLWLMKTHGKKPEDVCYSLKSSAITQQLTFISRSSSVETQQVATWLLVSFRTSYTLTLVSQRRSVSTCLHLSQVRSLHLRGASSPSKTTLPSETKEATSSAEWEESDGRPLSWVRDRSCFAIECWANRRQQAPQSQTTTTNPTWHPPIGSPASTRWSRAYSYGEERMRC
jgi:hypothetical protein